MRFLILTLSFLTAFAGVASAQSMDRAAVEKIIGEYIASHPQAILDSVESLAKQQQQNADAGAQQAVAANSDWLLKNKNHFEAGNPKGDVTVVEFFDYNCGYCKAAMPDLMSMLDSDKKLRLVFIEIPILGDSSVEAAKWALAAAKQKSYLEFHMALMRHKGPLDATTLENYAKQAGLDVERVKKDKDSPEVARQIEENLKMAQALNITGTPGFVIGKDIIRGYVGKAGLSHAVDEARSGK